LSGLDSPLAVRTLAGIVIAAVVTLVARRQHTLSGSGAAAGFVIGVICTAAGWSWALLLVTLFVSANALSRYHRSTKTALLGDMVEKGGERDAWQVAANGGVFTAAAMASLIHPSPIWLPLAAGAISASTADTWATEIGILADHPPKLITTGEPVPAGTSGGVTWAGTMAGLAGAIFIGILALLAGWGVRSALAAVAGGIAGSLIDSIAGATFQRRRWCERCGKPTERLLHNCGTITDPHGGIGWVDNDVVNALSSVTGGVVGLLLA
jgi:uncharacterized protein (TIGR00297 family)